MKTFYFVGGPKPQHAAEFFRRLDAEGGSPAGWQIYPHLTDEKALHVVTTDSVDDIVRHLARFGDIYEHSAIVEVRATPR